MILGYESLRGDIGLVGSGLWRCYFCLREILCDLRRRIVINVVVSLAAAAAAAAAMVMVLLCLVLAGSPSRGGDVVVYIFDIHQPSLSTPFYSALVSVSVFMAPSTVFHSINYPDNSPFSRCSFGLTSALLVLSTIYLFRKVSFSPYIVLVVDLAQNTN